MLIVVAALATAELVREEEATVMFQDRDQYDNVAIQHEGDIDHLNDLNEDDNADDCSGAVATAVEDYIESLEARGIVVPADGESVEEAALLQGNGTRSGQTCGWCSRHCC